MTSEIYDNYVTGTYRTLFGLFYITLVTGDDLWRVSTQVTGLQPTSPAIFSKTVRSKLECILMCQIYDNCVTSHFNKQSKLCAGFSMDSNKITGTEGTNPDIQFYKRLHKDCRGYGWEWIQSLDLCVRFSRSPELAHADARSNCQSEGGDLLQLTSEAKYDYFHEFIYTHWSDCQSVKLGATRVSGKFYWFDGSEVDNARYCPGEPYSENAAACIVFVCPLETWCSSSRERLDNQPCNDLNPYVCTIDTS